jgi:hypothetical protein
VCIVLASVVVNVDAMFHEFQKDTVIYHEWAACHIILKQHLGPVSINLTKTLRKMKFDARHLAMPPLSELEFR